MDPLLFIDEHAFQVEAPLDRAWTALLATLGGSLPRSLPRPLVALWGLQHSTRRGDWNAQVVAGDTIPGFAVEESQPPRRLTLRGRHRFSRYELVFELDSLPPRGVEIRAKTSAVFPGVLGRLYRALVIGSGGHRILVRRLLAAVARRAAR